MEEIKCTLKNARLNPASAGKEVETNNNNTANRNCSQDSRIYHHNINNLNISNPNTPFKDLLFKAMRMSLCECMPHPWRNSKGQERAPSALELELPMTVSHWNGCGQPSLCPLEEQQLLSSTKSSPQPPPCIHTSFTKLSGLKQGPIACHLQ